MFETLLIANRGEIACRVIRTARRLGIATVAVYSEADAKARHVREADRAVAIGPPAARESYLQIGRILEAAKRTGAQAIHPGYGFLSENAEFAAACASAGLIFVGPPASAIRAMGSKSAAKTLMAQAAVPVLPGYHGPEQRLELLRAEAEKIGYPVLLKATAGGGGKGMRIVDHPDDFGPALASCQREAAASFGDDRVLLEKYLLRPRHIEIQIFADSHGNCLSLFERDCSVQRRHQKVLEEAPAPGMTADRRSQMNAAAIAAARAVGYVGAGTVEFIAERSGRFYFMEMNTRLQVEHPVTEMITGLDLVEWQLQVAAGERIPLDQPSLSIEGHAIEARIYAEDPAKGFLPSTGTLLHLASPAESRHVRIDTGVSPGDAISPYYDPLIAKLIVWDRTREQARQRLLTALAQYQIAGVATNVEFLRRLAACKDYAEAGLDTGLIERERERLLAEPEEPPNDVYFIAAVAARLNEQAAAQRAAARAVNPHSPWLASDGWRLNSVALRSFGFRCGATERTVDVQSSGDRFELKLGAEHAAMTAEWDGRSKLKAELDGRSVEVTVVFSSDKAFVYPEGRSFILSRVDRLHADEEESAAQGGLVAPMPGRIVAHLAPPGSRVERGAPLIIMESMKMELTIVAPAAGLIRAFPFAVGDIVPEGATLVEYDPTT